jgi:hypothetical protein
VNDDAERRLEERLHDLAGGLMPPVALPADDLRRGRRRLVRVRALLAGATTAAVVAVAGLAGLTAGDPTATEISPAGRISSPALSPSSGPTGEPTAPSGDPSTPASTGSGDTVDPTGPGASASSGGRDSSLAGSGTGRGDAGHGGSHGPAASPSGEPSTQESSTQESSTPTDPSPSAPSTPQATDPTSAPSTGVPTSPSTPTSPTSPAVPTSPTTAPTTSTPTGPTGPTGGPSTPPTPSGPGTPVVPVPPPSDGTVRVHATLRYWNEVLATHLDPTRDHLAAYSRRTGNRQSTVRDGELFALGSTYAWDAAPLQVRVATGWDQVEWSCGSLPSAWSCTPGGLAGSGRSEVAVHDGVRQVAVEHADGQVVVLTATPSSARTTGIDADVDDLLAAAADTRLGLPGDAPVAPPTLDASDFEDAGVSALVDDSRGEQWLRTRADRAPRVSGQRSVDGASRGTLAWWAAPVYSGGGWTCSASYRTCTDVEIDGEVVHVASVRSRAGGGWVVAYEGASYVVSVYSADRTLKRSRAYAFVTDPEWQPAR